MKKLVALVCALCLLVAAVPAMAVDFDMGALADLFTMDEDTEESAEKDIEQMFEGETIQVDLAGGNRGGSCEFQGGDGFLSCVSG